MLEDFDFIPTTGSSEPDGPIPPSEARPTSSGSSSSGEQESDTPETHPNEDEVAGDLGELAVDETVEAPTDTSAGWDIAEETPPPTPEPVRIGVWKSHGPRGQDNPPAEIIEEVKHSDGKTYYKLRDPEDHGHQWFAPADEVEVISVNPGEEDSSPENEDEPIEEDSPESLALRARVESYLRSQGFDEASIEKVKEVLGQSQAKLIKEHLASVGVEPESLEEVAHLLKPLHVYLKRLHKLGLPTDKDGEASHFLHEETGNLRLKHLEGLIGGESDQLRLLMQTHHSELLAQELRRLGYDDAKISLIAATPRRNKSRLVNEGLKRLGLEEPVVERIELIVGMSEVPPEIVEQADKAGISLEDLVRAREAFQRADWRDTYNYLELAKTDAGARELLRSHGIKIEPTPESAEERAQRLEKMTLKEINERYPDEWQAERDRRVNHKRREFFKMLEKFRDYLPLDEFPLPNDVDVPPEESIPKDFPGAYGLWRRVVTDNLAKLLATENGYKRVLHDVERVGGPAATRRLGQKNMARRVLAAQRAREREMGVERNHGTFDLGRDQYQTNLRAIQELDTTASDIIRALDKFHRSKFTKDGQATPRRRLAELIVEHKLKEIALHEGRLDLTPPHQVKIPDDLAEPSDEDELSGEGMV